MILTYDVLEFRRKSNDWWEDVTVVGVVIIISHTMEVNEVMFLFQQYR